MTTSQASADAPTALRAALITETRIAEALAQRSRGLVDLVESLAHRALDDASDIAEARSRLNALVRKLRDGLAAGEAAEAGELRRLAETTLAAFDFGAGPRIAIDGPAVVIGPDARRLVSLALFDLASRSERFGALADPEGRVSLDWRLERGGGLRLVWREFGVRPGVERLRRGAGGPLIEILTERFGGPLRVTVAPCGLEAELVLPARDVTALDGAAPRRALVALADPAAAVTVTALLHARGVGEVAAVRDAAEATAALASADFGLVFTDAAGLDSGVADGPTPTIFVLAADAPAPSRPGPVLRAPVGTSELAAAMTQALRSPLPRLRRGR